MEWNDVPGPFHQKEPLAFSMPNGPLHVQYGRDFGIKSCWGYSHYYCKYILDPSDPRARRPAGRRRREPARGHWPGGDPLQVDIPDLYPGSEPRVLPGDRADGVTPLTPRIGETLEIEEIPGTRGRRRRR